MKSARIVVSLLLVTLAGCGSLSAPPKDMFYRLQSAQAASPAGTVDAAAPIIYVPPFSASGLHGERALVYAHDDGTTLEQYNYQFWVDSPRLLLQQALADHLRATVARQVVLEPSAAATYVVQGRIRKFERVASGSAPVARVTLQFEVTQADASVPQFDRVYERSLALANDSVGACAAALSEATGEIVSEFVRDLRAQWADD